MANSNCGKNIKYLQKPSVENFFCLLVNQCYNKTNKIKLASWNLFINSLWGKK